MGLLSRMPSFLLPCVIHPLNDASSCGQELLFLGPKALIVIVPILVRALHGSTLERCTLNYVMVNFEFNVHSKIVM